MSRIKTEAAQAAAQIREIIKSIERTRRIRINSTVRRDIFPDGDAVNIICTDAPAAAFDEIRRKCSKFQRGHFNGVRYICDSARADIPQVQYVFAYNRPSSETMKRIFERLRAQFPDIRAQNIEAFRLEYVRRAGKYGHDLIDLEFRRVSDGGNFGIGY
jgi:hypothetical protein